MFIRIFLLFPFIVSSYALAASIEVSKEKSLIDEEIQVRVTKLYPNETLHIYAQTVDSSGMQWQSFSLFQANEQGEIDLSSQAPLKGSYLGIDPMGFLWSMRPSEPKKGSSFRMKKEGFSIQLTAYRKKEKIASKAIVRLPKAPEIKKISVRKNGLRGTLFLPSSKSPLPVIITLSGSNGGLGEGRAQLLASYGFAVLALGFFAVDGLPPHLENIPLEYFKTAFTWVRESSLVDGSRIGLYGISRGGELALILGSWFPHSVQAIVAVVPSSVIHGNWHTPPKNAWMYQGKPLPSAPILPIDFSQGKGKTPHRPLNTLQNFIHGLKDKDSEKAAIPVEKINAPLLLVSGGDDQMWPSTLYIYRIEQRLKQHESPIFYRHLHYPKAGHGISIPNLPPLGPVYYHPIEKHWFSVGGTPVEDQHASQDSWKKLIAFFQATLMHKKETNLNKNV